MELEVKYIETEKVGLWTFLRESGRHDNEARWWIGMVYLRSRHRYIAKTYTNIIGIYVFFQDKEDDPFIDVNLYVDCILDTLLKNIGNRKVVLMSFSPVIVQL